MHTKRLLPDRFTYTALITAAGVAGDAPRLRQSYSDVSRSRGGPDGYVFSALFNAASQCKGIDLEWLLQVCAVASTLLKRNMELTFFHPLWYMFGKSSQCSGALDSIMSATSLP